MGWRRGVDDDRYPAVLPIQNLIVNSLQCRGRTGVLHKKLGPCVFIVKLNRSKRDTALALNHIQEPRLVVFPAIRNCNLKPVLGRPVLAGASPSPLCSTPIPPQGQSNMNPSPLIPVITPTVGSCSIGGVSYSGSILDIAHRHVSVVVLQAGGPNAGAPSSGPPVPLAGLPPERAPAFLSSLRETNSIIVLVV